MHLGTDGNTWCLRVVGLDPQRERGAATLLTVGNGFAGVRGILEEAEAAGTEPAVQLAGVYQPRPRCGCTGRSGSSVVWRSCPATSCG